VLIKSRKPAWFTNFGQAAVVFPSSWRFPDFQRRTQLASRIQGPALAACAFELAGGQAVTLAAWR
jgi:hypothetical protein